MARNLIPALVASVALAAALAACGEKDETIGTSTGTSTGSGAGAFAIAGDWSGQLTQKGLKPFLVAVRIVDPATQGSSQVAYTGINCGGEWALGPVRPAEGSTVPRYFFRETITTGAGGNCKGTGSVTITPTGEGTLSYEFVGGGVESKGTLTKTDEAGIAPTFAQAGVALSK